MLHTDSHYHFHKCLSSENLTLKKYVIIVVTWLVLLMLFITSLQQLLRDHVKSSVEDIKLHTSNGAKQHHKHDSRCCHMDTNFIFNMMHPTLLFLQVYNFLIICLDISLKELCKFVGKYDFSLGGKKALFNSMWIIIHLSCKTYLCLHSVPAHRRNLHICMFNPPVFSPASWASSLRIKMSLLI